MHYTALATDYDGTIAHDGVVDDATIAALERLRHAARRLILVTGRQLADLQRVMPRLDVFDVVVAENGGVLYRPRSREERLLAAAPDARLVARLQALQVDPLSVGRTIIASWEPNQDKVLEAIRELGLELAITFNKGAVMVLPAGVNKASGLRAALDALDLSPLNCVAVGDAENDMAFLEVAGASVAVANAVPALQERAAWVTKAARGAGVAELADKLLASDLAALDPRLPRQTVALAEDDQGQAVTIAPHRETVLLTGMSGGGKSTLTQGLTERLAAGGFQFCIVDPEGDYEGLEDAVGVGDADRPPILAEIVELLRKTDTSVVVNLLAIPLEDRPGFLAGLMPELAGLRAELGRPHVVVVDEAHHMLPEDWDPGEAALPAGLAGFIFVTTRPGQVSPRLLQAADRLVVVGGEPGAALQVFCQARQLCGFDAPDALPTGEALVLTVADGSLARVRVIAGTGPHLRHRRKYADGNLGEDRSFWFRGPDGRLKLRAQNLSLFLQLADGVDADTWQWHRQRGDFSRWIETSIKDPDLAGEVAAVERGDGDADQARRQVRDAVERRYTAPG